MKYKGLLPDALKAVKFNSREKVTQTTNTPAASTFVEDNLFW
jgi:hypothetical protein